MREQGASYREIYEIFNKGFDRLDSKLDELMKLKSLEHDKIHSRINTVAEEVSSIRSFVQLGGIVVSATISAGVSFIISLFKRA